MAGFDIFNQRQMAAIVRRMSNFAETIPEHHIEAGKNWYPQAHDITRQAGREFGTSTRSAAGVISALSAGTEWEQNKSAFHDLLRLTPEHEQMIQRSSLRNSRSSEVKNLLKEHYPGLSVSTDRNIGRALQMHRGADPEEVLNRRTNPKTNSFFRNILDPEGPEVTVDFRAYDMIANEMRPSRSYPRGITSADLVKGSSHPYKQGSSRFERMADVYSTLAGRGVRGLHVGNQAQAALWLAGKDIEMSRPTAKGGQRKVGIPRKGEPYMTSTGKPVDMGRLSHLNWDLFD
jgi:hypothetical protein